MRFLNGLACVLVALLFAACSGDKTDSDTKPQPKPPATPTVLPTPTPTPEPTLPPEPEVPGFGKLMLHDKRVERPGRRLPLTGIPYELTADTSQQQDSGTTTAAGEFEYRDAASITFTLLDRRFGPLNTQGLITTAELAQLHCVDEATDTAPAQDTATATQDTDQATALTQQDIKAFGHCTYQVEQNLLSTLRSFDDDMNPDNGIALSALFSAFPADLKAPIDVYERALAKMLAQQGRRVRTNFTPMLGINLEEPQPEADDVGGQPIPFVDLFRIGRPFPEYSCSQIIYDEYGWPVTIPPECADEEHNRLKVPSYATTLIARFAPLGTIPPGRYTVLYEGSGTIQYSGIGLKIPTASAPGRDIIKITTERMTTKHLNNAGLRVQISGMTDGDPIRNVRIIMPGGTCTGNPFVHVYSASDCPEEAYQSFVARYEQNSNAIVFNPQFMNFLKDFKVIRTMNFMKASPRNPCYKFKEQEYLDCLLQELSWEQRAKMNDAMWGGSYLTDLAKRAGRGVPLEVTVELANQLQRDPWFNLPHNATDAYIEQYASYVRDHLDPGLNAYIEYSNEPWNGPFWVNPYSIVQGKARAIDGRNDYWIGLSYYVERSVEVFTIWERVWGGSERLIRTINTQHNGGEFASRHMLKHNNAYQSIDALASAPYFFGCWNRASTRCQDEEAIPKVLTDITSVDDIFDILDNPNNPYGMASTRHYVKLQAEAAAEFGVDLIAYEGGQHLTVTWGDGTLSNQKKRSLLDLFRAANRDPRMAQRYTDFLNGWKANGGKLFTLYTVPQTYHTFGSFGIKEHLAQPRSAAPKYDASIQFQETQGLCWWEGCDVKPNANAAQTQTAKQEQQPGTQAVKVE